MRRTIALTLALAALAARGAAEPAPPRIENPDWAALPSAADIANLTPEAALRGVTGKAVVDCTVTAEGRLEDCTLVSEDPPGEGFGEAALAMAGKFRMKPKTVDGVPVAGARVRVPVKFAGDGPPDLPSPNGQFVYAGPAPNVRGTWGRVAKAAFYVDLRARKPDRNPIMAEMLLVLDHPLTGTNGRQSYVVLRQVFDCAQPLVDAPEMQFFDEAGQRTGFVPAIGDLLPMRPQFKLDLARALACGQAQPEGPVLGSIAEARADAKARFAADPK